MLKLDKNNCDNTYSFFFFYPLFHACSFCEKLETISFGPCNIMIAQQNIALIVSMCNIYKQLLHGYSPNS